MPNKKEDFAWVGNVRWLVVGRYYTQSLAQQIAKRKGMQYTRLGTSHKPWIVGKPWGGAPLSETPDYVLR